MDVLGAAAERLRDGPGGFGRGEVPNRHRLGRFLLGTLIVEGVPGGRRRGRPLGRRATRPHAPSGIVRSPRAAIATRHSPPLVSRRGVSPRARVKNWRARKLQLFLLGCQTFHKQGCRQVSVCRQCPVVDWTRSGTRRNQRVRSSRPLASRQLRSSKKGRATTTSPLNDQCLRRPRRPRPFQDFTQPSSRVPSRRTHPDPRVPRGVHTAPARHAAREPPSGGFSVEGTRPAKQGFQTPKRTAAYPARAPRVRARRPPNDGADVRQSGVHTRGTSQTFPPRPRLAPARSPPPPRRPKGAHLQKPNGPKTKNEIPK